MLFWLKVAHIAAVAVWFTGLLLLLRLFATRRRGGREARPDFFDPVANRLFFRVATPAGVLAIALGMSLIPGAQSGAWLLAKLCLVALVVLVHLWSGAHLHALGKGRARGRVLPAVLGWTPLLLLLAIAALTGAKPRTLGDLPPPGAGASAEADHGSGSSLPDAGSSSRSRWP
ncbi:CopD family protein [Luteimonas wenzhouensis]|uniref:CopD family protein n=1 Tax=Luteimonas wenzhouensis TaxID=2599615 RepID=UPI001FE711F4|nr:CopD family protein [Luteimonas wenzhouensis]